MKPSISGHSYNTWSAEWSGSHDAYPLARIWQSAKKSGAFSCVLRRRYAFRWKNDSGALLARHSVTTGSIKAKPPASSPRRCRSPCTMIAIMAMTATARRSCGIDQHRRGPQFTAGQQRRKPHVWTYSEPFCVMVSYVRQASTTVLRNSEPVESENTLEKCICGCQREARMRGFPRTPNANHRLVIELCRSTQPPTDTSTMRACYIRL